jgi:hypothetical protein
MRTNREGLPLSICRAIDLALDSYEGPRPGLLDRIVSVTDLIQPVRIQILKRTHRDEIVEDYADLLWAMEGTALHSWIARANSMDDQWFNMRLECYYFRNWKLSGELDEYDPVSKTIRDFKRTSAWSVIRGKDEWAAQLNIYAWLMERCHPTLYATKVEHLEVHAMCRDWSEHNTKVKGYPQSQHVTIEIPMWGYEATEAFIEDRISALEAGILALPLCTDEERWKSGKIYKRCAKYCAVRDFCTQFKESE